MEECEKGENEPGRLGLEMIVFGWSTWRGENNIAYPKRGTVMR